ncbi:MAG: Crp/Fnr family transcriptional regulator, partial [Rhodospirillaceae bacterium]
MEGSISPRRNKLLARLSSAAYRRVASCLEYHEYDGGDRLVQEARTTRYVHFPVFGAIARLVLDKNGHAAHFGVCGHEGLIGLSGLSGGDPVEALATVVVLLKTGVYRCPVQIVDAELDAPEVRTMVIRYFRYVLSEAMLTAFCNKHHSLHQQLCRLLLMLSDRTTSSTIHTTQTLLGEVLGSRREGITEATSRLRKENIITHDRGIFR